MSFPKDKPPHSVKVLHSWIAAYAKQTGQLPERVMRSVSYMVASQALERARDEAGAPLFLIKGGVMIELRLGLRARATRDLDAVFRAGWWVSLTRAHREDPGRLSLSARVRLWILQLGKLAAAAASCLLVLQRTTRSSKDRQRPTRKLPFKSTGTMPRNGHLRR